MSAATISSIRIYRQWQPFRDGTYRCSGGRSAEGFDSSIVEIASRDGLRGYGEMAPWLTSLTMSASTALIVGVQLLFSSFFLGILRGSLTDVWVD